MKKLNILLIQILFFSSLYSSTLKEVVTYTIENSPKIKAIESNNKANKYYIDESFGDYLPSLNYEAYIQDKKIIQKDEITGTTNITDEKGDYQQLKLLQNIYNGGLTTAKVEEAKHNYQANLISNIHDTEKLILDTVISYLDLVKYENANKLMKDLNEHITKKINEDYQLGHSYFMNINSEEDLEFVKEYKIQPLLEEYYYGDTQGLKNILEIINE